MDKLPDDTFSFVFVRQVYGFCEDWARSHPGIDDVDLSYNIGLLAHITNPRRWYPRGPSPNEMDHITSMLASVIAPCFREKAKELWDKIDHAATIYAIYSMPGFKAINDDGFIIEEENSSSITPPPPPPCSPSSSSSPAMVPLHSTPLKASQVIGNNEETDETNEESDETNDKEDPSIVVVVKRPRSPNFDKDDDDDDDEVPPSSEKSIIADPDYEHDELADYLSDDDDDDQDDDQNEQDATSNPPDAKKQRQDKQKIIIWIRKFK